MNGERFQEQPYVKQCKLYIETQPDGKRVLTTIATPSISEEDTTQFITNGDTLEVNVEDLDEIASRFFSDEFYITPDLTNKNITKLKIKSNKPLKINPGAFEYCSQLQSVEIECPEEVVICNNSFLSCYGLKDVSIKSKEKLDKVEFESDAFKGCSGLENVDISKSNDTIFSSGCFQGCNKLETVNQDATYTQIGANAFLSCRELKEFSFPTSRLNTANGVFKSCGNLENAHISNINLLTGGTCKKYSDLFENTKIHIKEAKVSDLIRNIDYKNFVFENLYIDSIDNVGIGNLNRVLNSYPPDSFKKIYIGQFEVSSSILNKGNIKNAAELFNLILDDLGVVNVLSSMYAQYHRDTNLINILLNKSNKEAIENNVKYFESLGIDASTAFLSTPNLLFFDIKKVFENIEKIRGFSTIDDYDIRTYYFDDTNSMIILDNPRSIEMYLVNYVNRNGRLPRGLNSLFCSGDYEDIEDRVRRLNYVSSSHITGRDAFEFLDRPSVETLKNLDNVTFNNTYGGYGDMSAKVNERIPNLRGIKSFVYEKLRGYIYQNVDENILFDEVFGDAIYENHSISEMLAYYDNICEFFDDSSSKDLEYKKNIICGRVLYAIIKKLKSTNGRISEEFVREQLYDFKNIRTGPLAPGFLSSNLDSVDDPDAINIMLRIDPYSFDLFRNYSQINDIPLRQQLLAYKAANNGDDKALRTLRKSANNRLLYNIDADMSGLFIGYEDVRYYYVAKASGYRFTTEEDQYYSEKIADFNRQLDELIRDKEFEQYKEDLLRYKIRGINIEPDTMTVFYEYLKNRVTPLSNVYESHVQEDSVRFLVDDFIDSESRGETSLDKILSAVDRLYRNFNPSIVYTQSGKIVDSPSLGSSNIQNTIEKIGVALIALNKMAHQQNSETISLDLLNRYRYQKAESVTQTQSFAAEVVNALDVIGSFDDIGTVYSELFCDQSNKTLKDSYFYRYIDSGEFEYLKLTTLSKEEADKLYAFFKDNYDSINKGNFKPSKDLDAKAQEEAIRYYAENLHFFKYLLRMTSLDENGMLIDRGNPLIISEEDKRKVIKRFNSWKRHYNNNRQISGTEVLSDNECLRIFKALGKVRSAIIANHDVVDGLVDNSITKRNMYALKDKFSKIFIQTLVSKLGSWDNKDSKDILGGIVNLPKKEKLEMFKNMGIILEIQEDSTTSTSAFRDVLVVYSKNIIEPYSIHLNQKVIVNDELRNNARENQLIVNSYLDNKNLTTNEGKFSFDFHNSTLDFSNSFRGNTGQGRATAILMNFLRIDLPVLFLKYGINRETLIKLLNNEISINENNLDEYLDGKTLNELREKLSNRELYNRINDLINGTLKMIHNLEESQTLSIPEEMILDDDSKYLRNYSFSGINIKHVSDIVKMIGKKDVKYAGCYKNNLEQMMETYSKILSDPESPKYKETLFRILRFYSEMHSEKLDNGTTSNFYYFGNDDIMYRVKSNKCLNIINGIKKKIDMSVFSDEDKQLKEVVEGYIYRICSIAIERSDGYESKLARVNEFLAELEGTNCMLCIELCNTEVSNLDEDFRKKLMDLLYKKHNEIKRNDPNNKDDLIAMLESPSPSENLGKDGKMYIKT